MSMAAGESYEEEADVVIIGAGIAGLATALALRRVGAGGVVVLEKAPGLRSTGAALALFPNAWRALAALGVAHKLASLYPGFHKGRVTNVATGATQEISLGVSFGSEGAGVRPVHRRVLLESLAEDLPPGTVRFSTKIVSITARSPSDASSGVVLRTAGGALIRAKVLIGCDGVHSKVAQWLGLSTPFDSGRGAVRAIAVYPDGHGFNRVIHQLLGKNERAGLVPLNDKEMFWFITNRSSPSDKEVSGDPRLILKHVTEIVAKDFPAWFLELVRRSEPSTVSWAPLLLRLPWDVVFGPIHRGNVVVAGDAMHPMTPDLAQGGCSALEDAVVLGRNFAACLRLDGTVDEGRVAGCLAEFPKERRWRVARLIAGSYVSGWMQQGGSRWWELAVGLVRDSVFYRWLFPKLLSSVVGYDCGSLPAAVRSRPGS